MSSATSGHAQSAPRRYPRAEVRMPITLLLEKGRMLEGLTKDICEGGIGAAVPYAISFGEKVIVKIGGGNGESGLMLLAAVRYRDGFLHGLEFTVVSAA